MENELKCDACGTLGEVKTDEHGPFCERCGDPVEAWSGTPCPIDPDNFWIDDRTGERVNASTGERSAA